MLGKSQNIFQEIEEKITSEIMTRPSIRWILNLIDFVDT